MKLNWEDILITAAAIVDSYDTSVTLRQLFYRLVSREIIPNTKSAYTQLSKRTAEARREGWFPALVDKTRGIHVSRTFEGADEAKRWLSRVYRMDRTEGQPYTLVLGVEKHGMVNQLSSWFGEYGIPIVSLGGYSSQSYVDEIRDYVERYDRPAVLIYAGDFDATGKDIDRDFIERTNCFTVTERVALNRDQIMEYNLPILPGKATDTRAARFIKEVGELVQVELDALEPDVLRDAYRAVTSEYFDMSIYREVMETESRERQALVV